MSNTSKIHFLQPYNILGNLLKVPFPIFILLLSLVIGISCGMSTHQLLGLISAGFGESIGYIALILLASFALASAISNSQTPSSTAQFATVVAPLAGASMVCPDTAYAALSPIAPGRKLSVLFGSYAGFKLLIPAGPAIVASMLGGLTPTLIGWGVITFIFCWGAGLAYASLFESKLPATQGSHPLPPLVITLPLLCLIGLIMIGALVGWYGIPLPTILEFSISPTGALIIAATIALTMVDAAEREAAFKSSINRTAPLLLIIGSASAFGAVLVAALSFETIARSLVSSGLVIPALFLLAAALKTAKGSSMATFAGAGGLVAVLLPSLNTSAEAATLALCAGAFVTIAPNDSLFWLVKRDAFGEQNGSRVTWILATGASLQGIVALMVVQTAVWLHLL